MKALQHVFNPIWTANLHIKTHFYLHKYFNFFAYITVHPHYTGSIQRISDYRI